MTRHLQLVGDLEATLVAAFNDAGWRVRGARTSKNPDLIVSKDAESFWVELKVAPQPTRALAEAMLSAAVLVGRASARSRGVRPLAVVGLEWISDRSAAALREFAARYVDSETAYGWIDARGRLELHGSPSLESIHAAAEPRARRSVRSPPRVAPTFSDLGQWILKVLLAHKLPLAMLAGPRAHPKNVRELAHVAAVSYPTAHRIVAAARNEGFLSSARDGLEIVDPLAMLYRWRRAASSDGNPFLAAKWILRKRDSHAALAKILAARSHEDSQRPPDACLGLFSAADQLGLGHVKGVPPHLLVPDLAPNVLADFGLRSADPGETADVFIGRPAYPESTFRGAVNRDGIWATDVVQTWLDTSFHPARGTEQADVIMRRVLEPSLAGGLAHG